MNSADLKLLARIQAAFPLDPQPYRALAQDLGTTATHVFHKVRALQKNGTVLRLGAVFEAHRLGFAKTLVAASVPPDCFRSVTEIINRCPSVIHNHRLEHVLNLWFILAAPSRTELTRVLADLRHETGLKQMYELPARTVYKGHVLTGLCADLKPTEEMWPHRRDYAGEPIHLSDAQRRLVSFLQDDLPSNLRPYDKMASALDCQVELVLGQIEAWLQDGVIGRLGAVLDPRMLGYPASGLAVMVVAEEDLAERAKQLAQHPEVTRVYGREPIQDWPYNLYAMIHGQKRNAVYNAAREDAIECRATGFEVLFMTDEYKKIPLRYVTETEKDS